MLVYTNNTYTPEIILILIKYILYFNISLLKYIYSYMSIYIYYYYSR